MVDEILLLFYVSLSHFALNQKLINASSEKEFFQSTLLIAKEYNVIHVSFIF